MDNKVLWYAWELLTAPESNAWFLMMFVFTFTCITFIITNIAIRDSIENIQSHLGIERVTLIDKVKKWVDQIK